MDFETISFLVTLVIYIVLNIICTVFAYIQRQLKYKLLFALMPLPLLIIIILINTIIFKAVVDINNPPFGTDYSGYFMGIIIILGLVMVVFYFINFISLTLISIVKGNKNNNL